MGVEPTRDRAERPLSRFEDGETHRGPYTSMGYSGIDLACCQANTPDMVRNNSRACYVYHVAGPGIFDGHIQ